jgi:hypothetical protein
MKKQDFPPSGLSISQKLCLVSASLVSIVSSLFLSLYLYEFARSAWCNYFFQRLTSVGYTWCRLFDWDFRPDLFLALIAWLIYLVSHFFGLRRAPYRSHIIRAICLSSGLLLVFILGAIEKALGPNPPNYY